MEAHVHIKLTADDVEMIAKAVVRILREEGLVATPGAAAREPSMVREESQIPRPASSACLKS